MRRREFIGFAGAAATWPLTALAQKKLPLIGFIGDAEARPDIFRGLADNGFVEGRDFRSEYRYNGAETPELVQARVALIVASFAAPDVKAAAQSIPVVFLTGEDPVAIGLAASLNRPGGNATGVTTRVAELMAKRLEILRELTPTAKVVGYFAEPSVPRITEGEIKELQASVSTLGFRLAILNVLNRSDIETGFATFAREHVDALIVGGAFTFFKNRDLLAALAISHKMPAIYPFRQYATLDGLASLGTRISEGWYLMGVYAARTLKGEKPSELPVQQVTKTELVLNLKTAKAMGLTVPPTLLARADEVIE